MEDHEAFAKQRGEEGWSALEQFLDLTNDEWRTAKRAMGGQQPQVMFVNGHQFDFPLDNMGQMAFMQQAGIVMALLAPGMPPQVVGPNPAMVQFAPVAQVEEVHDQVEEEQAPEVDGQGPEVEGQGLEVDEEQALEAEG